LQRRGQRWVVGGRGGERAAVGGGERAAIGDEEREAVGSGDGPKVKRKGKMGLAAGQRWRGRKVSSWVIDQVRSLANYKNTQKFEQLYHMSP
jgi:hypothetical protein